MAGRFYTIPIESTAATAAVDLWELLAPNDMSFALHYAELTQSTEAGDAQDEQLYATIRYVTGSPSSGSGGSSVTPVALNPGSVASSITSEVMNTTQLSGGTNTVLFPISFNVRAGFQFFPPPLLIPIFSPSTRCLIELESAPADSITFNGYAVVEEIGG